MSEAQDPLMGSEVLTQGEVERLLSAVHQQEVSTTVVASQGAKSSRKVEDIQPFDFRQPAFLAPSELRKIRLRHEDFIRALAAHLAIYLRLEFSLRMSKLQTLGYQKLAENFSNPTHLTLFKAEPLKGICLLDIPPHLGLTIVDRLLGGPAHSVNANRDLSDIEGALLDQAIQIILNEWCNQWQKLMELRPVVLGHETNPRFLHTAAHDTVMLVLSMEATLGDCIEQMQLAFPYYTLEPLVRQISAQTLPELEPNANAGGRARWSEEFGDIPVPVTAEWRGLEIMARTLGNLKPGDVLTMESECHNRVLITLAGLPKFRGRLGTRGPKWAIELNEKLKT